MWTADRSATIENRPLSYVPCRTPCLIRRQVTVYDDGSFIVSSLDGIKIECVIE